MQEGRRRAPDRGNCYLSILYTKLRFVKIAEITNRQRAPQYAVRVSDPGVREAHSATSMAPFRGDVNGLRSLAIVPVVLLHAGVSAIPGGFVGVDVFFVISGFLITGHLFRQAEAGQLNLLEFWARRLRRLYPTLALVVVTTMVLSALLLSPLEMPAVALQSAATMLSVSNILFAREATDYFGQDVQQSPLLHTWSLGVEEQFYLVLPFVIVLSLVLGRRRIPRAWLGWILVTGAAGSYALSIVASSLFPHWAFYTLPTRVWEFAVGGLVALMGARLWIAESAKRILVWAGIGMVLASLFVVTGSDPYPGAIALLPVLGTALVIFGGSRGGAGSRMLATRPLQWIGTRSYSWYLWHWPLIVFGRIVFDSDSVWIGLGGGLASLGLAAFTYRYFEWPLRTTRTLTRNTGRTYRVMASIAAVCLVFAAALYSVGEIHGRSAEVKTWASAYHQAAPSSCEVPKVAESGTKYCISGDASSSDIVLIIGDSHAAQWVPLLDSIGSTSGYQIAVRSLDACPAAAVSVAVRGGIRNATCDAYHVDTIRLIDELEPGVVITSSSNSYIGTILDRDGDVPSASMQADLWASGYRSVVEAAQAAGATVVAIEDTYRPKGDPAVCMTRPWGGIDRCEPDRSAAVAPVTALVAAERSVQGALGVRALAFTERLCSETKCPITDSEVPIFADVSHVSSAWAANQEAGVRELIAIR